MIEGDFVERDSGKHVQLFIGVVSVIEYNVLSQNAVHLLELGPTPGGIAFPRGSVKVAELLQVIAKLS